MGNDEFKVPSSIVFTTMFYFLCHLDLSLFKILTPCPEDFGFISKKFVQRDISISKKFLGGFNLTLVLPDENLKVNIVEFRSNNF